MSTIIVLFNEPDSIKIASDTIHVVADTTEAIDWSSASEISKNIFDALASIATIIGIFVGLYLGRKGLKKYLIDDHIKTKFNEIKDKNSKTSQLTADIIHKISEKDSDDLGKEITDSDLIHINSLTKKLYKTAFGASQPVATLAYFLEHTLNSIDNSDIDKYSKFDQKPSASDFYRIIFNTCKKISVYANNVVDIPESIELEPMNDLKSKYQEFVDNNDSLSIKGYNVGINLNSNSPYSLIFANLVDRSSSTSSIFKKNFYKVLGDNTPELHLMYHQKIYFPPTLKSKKDHIFGFDEEVHLIKVRNVHKTKGSGETYNSVYFYYTNLQPFFNFVDNNLTLDNLKSDYYDSFLNSENSFLQIIDRLERVGNETIVIECKQNELSKYFDNVKKDFKLKMNSLDAR